MAWIRSLVRRLGCSACRILTLLGQGGRENNGPAPQQQRPAEEVSLGPSFSKGDPRDTGKKPLRFH